MIDYTRFVINRSEGLLDSHYRSNRLNPVSCMAVALMLTTGRRTTKEATSLIQDNYKINGIKRLELKKTKTSKKSKFVSFKLGDEAVNILNTIYLRVTNALNLVENLYFS